MKKTCGDDDDDDDDDDIEMLGNRWIITNKTKILNYLSPFQIGWKTEDWDWNLRSIQ